MAVWNERPDAAKCPDNIVRSLIDYRDNGTPKGHFLTMVLENKLRQAIERADDGNYRVLPHIVAWCYNHLPLAAWGSEQAVSEWISLKADERKRNADAMALPQDDEDEEVFERPAKRNIDEMLDDPRHGQAADLNRKHGR